MAPPLYVAFGLLVALTVCVRALRGPKAASGAGERRTKVALGIAHGVSLVVVAASPWVAIGRVAASDGVAWAAVGAMAGGFALQVWSMRTLGPLFTTSLQAADAQPVIARGPYRVVRHPGYLGQIVFWVAFAACARNVVAVIVVAVVDAIAYGLRIRVEERMLSEALGERYAAYAARRARLIPGLW